MRIFFTGDGECPICGKMIMSDMPSTHHTHIISNKQASRTKAFQEVREWLIKLLPSYFWEGGTFLRRFDKKFKGVMRNEI